MPPSELIVPIVRPALPSLDAIAAIVGPSHASGRVTLGEVVRSFEQEVAARSGSAYAVAVSSGTAGLLIAWRSLGFEPGSEVICPSYTFAATVQALMWNRLVPVFVDCRSDLGTLDVERLEGAVSPATRAICPVNVFGLPPDYDEIAAFAHAKGLRVVSDSAQGLGSFYRGRPFGSQAEIEVFSLSPTKVVTGIEGGVLTTNDRSLADRWRSLRDYGKALDGPSAFEDMSDLGLSARLSEFHAAIALLNLRRRESLCQERLSRMDAYREALADLPGCTVQEQPSDRVTSGNYFVLYVGPGARVDRDVLRSRLAEAGIQTKRYFHPPAHQLSCLRGYPSKAISDLENTLRLARQGLALPCFNGMSEAQLQLVVQHIRRALT